MRSAGTLLSPLAATARMFDLLAGLGEGDFVLALISGGASALLIAPAGAIMVTVVAVSVLALAVLGLCATLRRAPWGRLREPVQLNLLLGFAVGLMLIWSMRAGVKPGLNLHMLGAMAATLALGPWFAVLALALT